MYILALFIYSQQCVGVVGAILIGFSHIQIVIFRTSLLNNTGLLANRFLAWKQVKGFCIANTQLPVNSNFDVIVPYQNSPILGAILIPPQICNEKMITPWLTYLPWKFALILPSETERDANETLREQKSKNMFKGVILTGGIPIIIAKGHCILCIFLASFLLFCRFFCLLYFLRNKFTVVS